jgi:hypothetical protein
MKRIPGTASHARSGIILVLAAVVLVVVFAFTAFSVDIGYITHVKGELQNAADAAALAGCREIPYGVSGARLVAAELGLANRAGQLPISIPEGDITPGVFDYLAKSFTPTTVSPNALRVIARASDRTLFFGPAIKSRDFDTHASAIAMLNPREIVFVVDLSGSMNDDTEPCWATDAINAKFGPAGYPSVATPLMNALFADFGYGTYPGMLQHIGQPLGVAADDHALAEMTKDEGPLSDDDLASDYRISNWHSESTRKQKAYRWIIDNQIAVIMPNALPAPSEPANFGYWEKYLDYVIQGAWVGDPPPPSGSGSSSPSEGGGSSPQSPSPPIGWIPPRLHQEFQPLHDRTWRTFQVVDAGWLSTWEGLIASSAISFPTSGLGLPRREGNDYQFVPSSQDGDRIQHFNNPNKYTFPAVDSGYAHNGFRNKIGYLTYIQFMMDWGRDRSPDADNATNAQPGVATKTPASLLSAACPRHTETTAGGAFEFPPREQPMHAVRRSLIAAIEEVRLRNVGLSSGTGDRVAIVTFDALDAEHSPKLAQPLTAEWNAAMLSCTGLQAVSDIGSTTATEAGLALARDHLRDTADGGAARPFANRVIILLTDGVPNAWESSASAIADYMSQNPSGEFYDSAYLWYNAPLMQASMFRAEKGTMHVIGMGLGADYDFLDRMARVAGTDISGQSVRGSGNPAEYEQRLTDTIGEIVRNPGSRLVK